MRFPALYAVLLLLGCDEGYSAGGMAKAKDAAAQKLRDPDSAKFRNVETCPDNEHWFRGEINGKNAFGAYAGFSEFYAIGSVAYLVDELEGDFGWMAGDAILSCRGSEMNPDMRAAFIEGMPEPQRSERLKELSERYD